MLGDRIREARLHAGLTQAALAKALQETGYYTATETVISEYEMGASTPKPSVLLEMSRILSVESAYFAENEPTAKGQGIPTPTELLAMPADERERWIQRSFDLAADEDFETFDAFGEEAF